MIDLMAALTVQQKIRREYQTATDRKDALVVSASIEKKGLPDNYWQEQHRLACKLNIINGIVEVLRDG